MNRGEQDEARLQAARRVADGGDPGDADGPDQARYYRNLQAIARLSRVFAGARSDQGDATPASQESFTWGHLRVTRLLGRGSFGRVYRAFDTVLQRDVALKLRPQTPRDVSEMDARAYIEEARRLARVRHPNVLAVHGADVHDGVVGIWTDLLEGETLEQVARREAPLETARVLEIGRGLSRALAAVHANGVVHGDVKAANVMLEPGGQVVLMDFGAGGVAADHTTRSRFGSPMSMAPEQLAGAAATAAGDTYALGVLLYRLLTGHYPGESRELDGLLAARRQAAFPPVRRLRRAVPQALARLVERLLHPTPRARPDAAAAEQAIQRTMEAPARRRRHLAVAAVLASLSAGIVVATAGYYHARQAELEARVARGEAEAINRLLLGMMQQAAPLKSPGGNIQTRRLLQAGQQSIEDSPELDPQIRATLLLTLANLYREFEIEEQADRLSEQALAAVFEAYGEGSAPARRALVNRAATLQFLGDRRSAMPLFDAALAHARADAGSTPAERADVLWRRGTVATKLEQFDRARADLVEALVLARQDEARPPMLEARILQSLGYLERYTGDYQSAREHLDRAIATLRRHKLPNERYHLAAILQQRALLARDATGELAVAEAMQREVLDIYRDLHHQPVKAVATAEYEVGSILQSQGKYQEALPYFERALEIYRQGGHLEAEATAAMTAAKAYSQLGEFDKARQYLAITEANYRQVFGASHFYIAILGNQRALVELEDGRHALAESRARQALDTFRSTVGDDHPVAGTAMLTLGRALLLQGRPGAAQPYLERVLSLWLEHFGADDWRVADARLWSGRLYAERGDWPRAEAFLHDALARFNEQPERFGSRIAEARALLEGFPEAAAR